MKKWIVSVAIALAFVSCGKEKYTHARIAWESLLLVTTNMWASTTMQSDDAPNTYVMPEPEEMREESKVYYKSRRPVTIPATNGRIVH